MFKFDTTEIFNKLTDKSLFCFEKIVNPKLFETLEGNNQICELSENWDCCSNQFKQFSNLIIHIEEIHLKIQSNNPEKYHNYICDQCENNFFEFNSAIKHYLEKHIIHSITCLNCTLKIFNGSELANHITICENRQKK